MNDWMLPLTVVMVLIPIFGISVRWLLMAIKSDEQALLDHNYLMMPPNETAKFAKHVFGSGVCILIATIWLVLTLLK